MILRISKSWAAVVTAAAWLNAAGSLPASEPVGAPPAVPSAEEATASSPAVTPLAPASLDAVPPAPEILQVGRRSDVGLTRRQEKQLLSSGVIMDVATPQMAPIVQGAPATGEVVFDSSSPEPYTDDGTHGAELHPSASTEGAVRVTDRAHTAYGYGSSYDYGMSKYDLKKICPECRIAPDGLPYHLSSYDPTDRQLRRYRLRHGLKFSPDYGFCPPGKLPIDYVSIDYARQFPASWNGQQSAQGVVRPQVYWPTDTTQLGYTYQHAPRWLPAYGMIPPVPHPNQWNIPACSMCGTYGYGCRDGVCNRGPHGNCRDGNCRDGNCRNGNCRDGNCRHGNCPQANRATGRRQSAHPHQAPCPSCQPGAIIRDGHGEAVPEPTPNEVPAAPAPPQSAAFNGPSLNAPFGEPMLVPVPR